MSLKTIGLAIAFGAIAVLSSCTTPDGKAQSQATHFIENETYIGDYDVITWSKLDSTFHVSDSALQVMHAMAAEQKLTKPTAKYQPRTEKLHLLTLRYRQNNDTLMATFYLDDQLTGIVGMKKD